METQSADINHLMTQVQAMHNKYGVIIAKDSKGHKGGYASLPQVLETIHKWTTEFKLVLTQGSRLLEGHNVMETTLFHTESKQFIKCHSYLTPADSATPDQAWGGSTTYHRRYDAMALLGLFADEDPADNDGNNSSNASSHGASKPNFVPAAPGVQRAFSGPANPSKSISEPQIKLIKTLLKGNEEAENGILDAYEVSSIEDLNMGQATMIIDGLKKKPAVS